MKKLLVLISALLLTISASAQFGIIGGLTTTSISNPISGIKTANTFHAGFTVDLPLALGFDLQPSLIYNLKGKCLADGTVSDYQIGYVELPLQLQWGINLGKVIRPYIFGEPFAAYAAHARVRTASDKWEKVVDWGNVNRWSYGLGLGGGVKLFNHLQVNVRYYWEFEQPLKNIKLKENITKDKCKGVRLSAAILF